MAYNQTLISYWHHLFLEIKLKQEGISLLIINSITIVRFVPLVMTETCNSFAELSFGNS